MAYFSADVINKFDFARFVDFQTTLNYSSQEFQATARLASVIFDSNSPAVSAPSFREIHNSWTLTPTDRVNIKVSVESQKINRFLLYKFGYGNECSSDATMTTRTVGAMEGTCFQDGALSFTVYASGLSHIFH